MSTIRIVPRGASAAARRERSGQIALLFPPLFPSAHPHLAVPHLTAYLRRHGCEVRPLDYNAAFIRLGRRADLLDVTEALIHKCLAGTAPNSRFSSDWLAKHLALAAIASLRSELEAPITESTFPALLRQLYCLTRGFGFPNHHLYNHDFPDFVDDYFLFQRVKTRTHDARFPWRTASTIDQELDPAWIANQSRNIYLQVFRRFFAADLLRTSPRIVGISIPTNEQLISALSLACLVKQEEPAVHVTLGGACLSHLSQDSTQLLARFPFVDSLVVHEGEVALLSLVRCLDSGSALHNVPNLVFETAGNVHVNAGAEPESLAAMPPPDYDGFAPLLDDHYVLGVYVARGCYWSRCEYCNYVTLGAHGRPRQHGSVAALRLVEQMESLASRHGVSHFRLVTEALPPALCRDLCAVVLDRRLRVRLNTWLRVERQFTPDLCQLMAAAGLTEVTLGVESFCDRTLAAMGKGYTARLAARIVNNMLDAGLSLQINMIVGYPTETRAESEESLRFLQSEINVARLASVSVFPFVLFRNIGVYRNRDALGLAVEERSPSPGRFFPKDVFARYHPTRGMNLEELAEMTWRYAEVLESIRPSGFRSSPALSTRLTTGVGIAGVKLGARDPAAQDVCPNGAKPLWLIANFDRGNYRAYPVRMGTFFGWLAARGDTTPGECTRFLGRRCGIPRHRAVELVAELLSAGIVEAVEDARGKET